MMRVCGLIFFFQAEDGIRDLTVTGVQTCALPIWNTSTGDTAWVQPFELMPDRLNVILKRSDTSIVPQQILWIDYVAGTEYRGMPRSEERRVGKECRSRWSPYH